ncbi:hypothetical protein THMIRHAS_02270 [Thiosulfatimonas sediminis]|uniref:Polymerase beta nucleotidyltransferase domain-containing protein n=1 Tax=Thiosulfatimonas sediminis TaxID=2675054 RepID=A0A6F8PS45_9GAMM|nr:nucleotidyltransferase domain-containing protein [Thiosulfatimonas sediminis]BBP44854.1 hypothetical protein THMIRHAS_02270 [Thiosulfatimonas sediminis]
MLQLSDSELQEVLKTLTPFLPEESKVFAYGSRTKGTARDYSDLDLAIQARNPLPLVTLFKIRDAFEFSELPFRVDVHNLDELSDSIKNSTNLIQIT